MSRDYLLDVLTMLGLTNREAEVFLAIAARGEASVKDLLESVDIHQPQLYNILSSLLRRGFIRVSGTRPKVYIAYDLSTIIETHVSTLLSIKESVKGVGQSQRGGSQISISYGMNGINNGVVDVVSNAKTELYGELPQWMLRSNIRLFMDALNRGVNLYLLIYPGIDNDCLSSMRKYGDLVRARTAKLGDFLLLVADFERGIYASRRAIMNRSSASFGYLIQDIDIIARFLDIFSSTWSKSSDALRADPEKSRYPRRYLNAHFASLDLKELLGRGHRPLITVRGIDIRRGEPIEVRGVVSSVESFNRVSSIIMESDGRRYSIGGYDAEIEDIEAREVIIEAMDADPPR
ncbi:hypothetical protein GCM10007981_05870 [Thermocladium modestius]|uniref:TrmB family transcriptional regulator n=1 Tax=Thermocladium modestius TaxID=62609 RepID=A0A830GUT3_9CREN|nr:TrmB family transcriptional regulator sugar-binding domain-containing protein [Thermocladium modestius]GGP19972.1 hypothetical protein GCM10007981_05870 [Thermocladium modestius]